MTFRLGLIPLKDNPYLFSTKPIVSFSAALLFCACCSSHWTAKDFIPLHELEGTWMMQTKKGALYELWQKKDSHRLESKSYHITGPLCLTKMMVNRCLLHS